MFIPNSLSIPSRLSGRGLIAAIAILSVTALTNRPAIAQEDAEPATEPATEAVSEPAAGWPSEWATSLATVDDGATVFAATANGLLLRESSVVQTSVASPAETKILYTQPAGVWKVVANQQHVCSTDYRGNLAIMNRENGEVRHHPEAVERWCRALAISPDGTSLVAGNETGKLFVWSFEKDQAVQTAEIDTDQIYEIDFAPAGDQLVVADGGGHLHVLSWPELTEVRKIELGTEPIWSAKFVADGSAVIAGGAERKLWHAGVAADVEPVAIGETGDWITSIAVSPAGDTMFAATMDGNIVSRSAAATTKTEDGTIPRLEPVANLPSGVWALAMPTDNQLLAATRKHALGKLGRAWKIQYAEEPGSVKAP